MTQQAPKIGTPALVRGGSTALAMLLPGSGALSRLLRTGVVAGGFLASSTMGSKGRPQFLVLSTSATDKLPAQAGKYANLAIGTASWVGVQALIAHAAALLPLPKVVKALGVSAALAAADQLLGDRTETFAGKAQAMGEQADDELGQAADGAVG